MSTETYTDSRIGRYLSSNGVVHTDKRCGTRSRRTPVLLTQEDAAYFEAQGVEHSFCQRCTR